ncbi:MAG: response regulator transcription factor [Bacteroidota bacterium]
MKKIIHTLLVDDHKVILDGIASFLQKEERIKVVGKATNIEQMMHILANKKVDLILMDINMPNTNTDGIRASREVKAKYPNIKIILLTGFHKNRLYFSRAVDVGINGYLAKDKDLHLISKAIYEVMDEGKFVTYGVDDDIKRVEGVLTEREIEIVQMICNGKMNKEIADEIDRKIRTVERYRKTIYKKTGTDNTAALVRYAIDNNICD